MVPAIGTLTVLGVSAKTAVANESRRAAAIDNLCVFMSALLSQRRGKDVGRRLERHALGRRDRRRQRAQEGRPAVVDLPPHEHGVVLVDRVVAVLHEHPAPVAELHRQGDAPARPQPVDVLAAALPGGNVRRAAVAGQDLALLEVDVDRVIPAGAAVDDGPDLLRPGPRRSRDATEVGGQRSAPVVGLDAPWPEEAGDRIARGLAGAAVELEYAGPRE